MSKRQYPYYQYRGPNSEAVTCSSCHKKIEKRAGHIVDIQVNWMRGEDEVVCVHDKFECINKQEQPVKTLCIMNPPKETKSIPCGDCGKKFRTEEDRRKHRSRKHRAA